MRKFSSFDDLWFFTEELIDQAKKANDDASVKLLQNARTQYHMSEFCGELRIALKIILKKTNYLNNNDKNDIEQAIKFLTRLINQANRPGFR
jgi:hypothetical protein